jgi:predicted HD superfamily hydrolase involved in NAD metabolism
MGKKGTVLTTNIQLAAVKYVKQGAFVEELVEHLEGTAQLTQELAVKYELSPEEGYQAGYWHDISRGWSSEQSRESFRILGLELDAEELSAGTSLIHGHIATRLWQEEFGTTCTEWQNAIACHTLGTQSPTIYDQIIGVADFAAYNRKNHLAEQIRQLAANDLFKAYLTVYESKVKHLLSLGKKVHPQAQNTVLALQRSQNAG